MSEPMVEAAQLVKVHRGKRGGQDFRAVDGIDFTLHRGEAFGFLGPNGAGKSSTMRMISCVSPPTSGFLRVLGMDPAKQGRRIRARLGVVPQDDSLDRELTVRENLLVYGTYFDLPKHVVRERTSGLLDFAQLTDKADQQVSSLSGGMRRRLTIARSLINEPEVLLLDEPTTGLDPQARHVLWERLFQLKERGVTLVLTTHYMDEAEQLCDRIAVMDRGRFVAEGTPRELIAAHVSREVLELRYPSADRLSAAQDLSTVVPGQVADRLEVLPDRVLLYTADGEKTLAMIHGRRFEPQTALVRRASLEDVFLTLTGRSLVE